MEHCSNIVTLYRFIINWLKVLSVRKNVGIDLTNGESKVATRLRRNGSPGLCTKSSAKRLKYKYPRLMPATLKSGRYQCVVLWIIVQG